MDSSPFTPEFFDPHQEARIVWRKLPHWSQAGVLCFITFRTFDSIPAKVLATWHAQRDEWLRGHGFDPNARTWNTLLRESPQLWAEFHKRFSNRWHDNLDAGHGECVLRSPDLAVIVEKSLMHFDGDRYLLTDFVVMFRKVAVTLRVRKAVLTMDAALSAQPSSRGTRGILCSFSSRGA
jgi:hypothetical protein